MSIENLAGRQFGQLKVINLDQLLRGGRVRPHWLCQCDCGSPPKAVDHYVLLRGDALSCGCVQRQAAAVRRTTHGQARTRLHRIWMNMLSRCSNPNVTGYHNYGGRGISVCAAWRESFEAFASAVGQPPSRTHSLDRWPDMDGNYEPGNVRWATAKEQGRHRRGLIEVYYQGRHMCLKEAAELAGLTYATVHARIVRFGWSPAEALTVPAVTGQKYRHNRTAP